VNIDVEATCASSNQVIAVLCIHRIYIKNDRVFVSGKIQGTIGRTKFDDDFTDIVIDIGLSAKKRGVSQISCGIIYLNLGPITLDVLGIVMQTSEIVLDLTGLTCANNLVGNLMCVLANLLDGGTATPGVSDLVVALQSLMVLG